MQHAALCLSGTADVSVQLTPYAAYRDSGAKPWAWSSYEGLKLGSYCDFIAYNKAHLRSVVFLPTNARQSPRPLTSRGLKK